MEEVKTWLELKGDARPPHGICIRLFFILVKRIISKWQQAQNYKYGLGSKPNLSKRKGETISGGESNAAMDYALFTTFSRHA